MAAWLKKRGNFTLWHLVFGSALLWRAMVPFLYNPMHHLYSDPHRHWLNGTRLFAPDVMGSSDPLIYQLWTHLLWRITEGNAIGVACFTAVLCVGMAWFWYLALREILPRRNALIGATVIALTPTLTFIYGFFMNETLLLALMAAATWATLRAMRRRDAAWFVLAALLWALASYTRIVALPVALLFLTAALSVQCCRPLLILAAVVPFLALAWPACWHSRLALNFCAPFGNGYLNEIYHQSREKVISVNVLTKGRWGFMSPSQVSKPFAPVSDWYPERFGEHAIEVDPAHGRADWQRALAQVQANATWRDKAWTVMENAVNYFFVASWPDNHDGYLYGRITIASRWLWLPLTAVLLALACRRRRALTADPVAASLPAMGVLLSILVLFQHSAVMESRYRKPVEPYVLAGLAVLLARRKSVSSFDNTASKEGI